MAEIEQYASYSKFSFQCIKSLDGNELLIPWCIANDKQISHENRNLLIVGIE